MIKNILIICAAICLFSCSNSADTKQISSDIKSDMKNEQVNRSTEFLPEPDIKQRLELQRIQMDSLVSRRELDLEVLVKEPDKEDLTLVVNEEWPRRVETSFNVWKNPEGVIKVIGEYPFSESGDWSIGYVHYFDKVGRTYSFMRNTNFFNSECTEGLASEEIIEYYNKDFNRVDREYSLTDARGEKLDKNDCTLTYDYPYDVSKSVEDFLKSKNVK